MINPREVIKANEDKMDSIFARERTLNQLRVGNTRLPENLRLILQCLEDDGGETHQFPMWLDIRDLPKDSIICISPKTSPGIMSFRITEKGRSELFIANTKLGASATRYACRLKSFGHLEPIVYGYPFLVPLSKPVWNFQGSLVIDRPPPDLTKSILAAAFPGLVLLAFALPWFASAVFAGRW